MKVDANRLSAAADGELLNIDEVIWLLQQPDTSLSAYQAVWAAQKMGRRLADNFGQVYAQIGIDANPCPENCLYCSFAAVNSRVVVRAADDRSGFCCSDVSNDAHTDTHNNVHSDVRNTVRNTVDNTVHNTVHNATYNLPLELPPEEVIECAKTLSEAGVHLISLMATAAYDFETFCTLASAVRKQIKPKLPLLANIGDIDYEEALRLKEAGIDAFYHTIRIGEGVITRPDPQARRDTIEALKRSGIKLMSGIEPLYQELSANEIANKIVEINQFEALASGVCSLRIAPGSVIQLTLQATPLKLARLQQIAAVARLASSTRTQFGFCGGIVWVDAGGNPRGRKSITNAAELTEKVLSAKQKLIYEGWLVPEQPLAVWQ